MRKTKRTKEEPHRQQGGSIHRPTQVHNSTQQQCSYFDQWKTKKKFGIMHQKIENKGNKSYGQFSRNLERKIKKTASIMLY